MGPSSAIRHHIGRAGGRQVLRRQILEMAKMFIAGTTVEDAKPTLVKLWKNGCACSIDLLGEASVSESEADHYVKRCREALTLLGRDTASWPSSSLGTRSSRTPASHSSVDQIICDVLATRSHRPRGRLSCDCGTRPSIVESCAEPMPTAVTFDMEQARGSENSIVTIFMRLFSEAPYRSYAHAGIALRAYLPTRQPTSIT